MHPTPIDIDPTLTKKEFYENLLLQAKGIIDNQRNWVTNLANISSLISYGLHSLTAFQAKRVNWAGFYVADPKDPNILILGPFQGKIACVEIPFGKGVCGAAALSKKTQLVKDVHAFPGHIACDSASNSEIVVPLVLKSGRCIGVIDIDNEVTEAFDEEDQEGLEMLATIIVDGCDWWYD